MSNIRKKNAAGETTFVRPDYIYHRNPEGGVPFDQIHAELLQSTRNVLEQIRDSQMLQCDVRADIRKMRIALEKIARNTSRRRRTRKVTA